MNLSATATDPSTPTAAGAASAASAALPSNSSTQADASAGITAPSANSASREAYERLSRGEQPHAVNAEFLKAGGEKQGPAGTRPQDKGDANGAPNAAAPAVGKDGWPSDMDPKVKQVLKRGNMDPEAWGEFPKTTQDRLLASMRAKQADRDRQRPGAKQQPTTKTTQPPAGTDAARGQQPQAATEHEDPATLADDQLDPDDQQQPDGDGDDAAAGGQQQQQQGRQPAPAAAAGEGIDQFFSAQDRATLTELGGPALAETFGRGIGAVVQHFQAREGQILGVVEFLLGRHIDGEFDAGLAEISATPGFDGLARGHADFQVNSTKLREKATLLHRAAGNPASYSYREAVRDAAASLFKPNLHQTHQAALLAGRQRSLRGSPDRADGQRHERQPLTPAERNRQIYAQLAGGLTPPEARGAVDGA